MTFPPLDPALAAPLTRRQITTVLGSIIASADSTEDVTVALNATIDGLHGWCRPADITAAVGEIFQPPAFALCAV